MAPRHAAQGCSVASRTAEIGTLRALGFRRGSILWAFLLESLLLGAVAAGCIALGLHSFACARWIRLLGSQS